MANPNGRKGSQFETDVMKWLRKMGAMAERLTKAGAKDEGDMVVVIAGKTYILELKNRYGRADANANLTCWLSFNPEFMFMSDIPENGG